MSETENFSDEKILEAIKTGEKIEVEESSSIVRAILLRSLTLLMISIILSTGLMISTIAITFIENNIALILFKVFCVLASFGLMIISILLVFKISSQSNSYESRHTLREY